MNWFMEALLLISRFTDIRLTRFVYAAVW